MRIKFKTTISLISKIMSDTFLLNKLICAQTKEFTEAHEEKCKDKIEQKLENYKAQQLASKSQIEGTRQNLARQKIMDMLNDE